MAMVIPWLKGFWQFQTLGIHRKTIFNIQAIDFRALVVNCCFFMQEIRKNLGWPANLNEINGKCLLSIKILSTRTEKTKTSWTSFVGFRRSNSKNKKKWSREARVLSGSAKIIRIVWIVPEIFGFEILKFSGLRAKSQNVHWAGSCSSVNQNWKTKKTYLGSSLNFQNLLEFLKSHE